MRWVRTTDASEELFDTATAKTQLKVDHTDEDTFIGTLITVARQIAEEYCNRSFVTQTWKSYMNEWPSDGVIRLPMGKTISVVGIDYSVSAAHDTELATSGYNTGLETDIGLIKPVDSWPETDSDYPNSIEIETTCGYGNAAAVPKTIVQAVKIILSDLYENRQSFSSKTVSSYLIGEHDKKLWEYFLDPYKIYL